jgi:hypothetical protein
MSTPTRLTFARLLTGLVLLWNVQCALSFLLWPERYAPGFELSGAPGAAAVRGMGVLFIMWNVPYALATWHPLRYRVSLYEALAMQSIGFAGETLIYLNLPAVHALARSSIGRFMFFDGAGVILLLLAAIILRPAIRRPAQPT